MNRQHYHEANNIYNGDDMPFVASDAMLCLYLVATIILCVLTA